MKENKKQTIMEEKKTTSCGVDCPVHGNLKVRGRMFKGYVIRKMHKRIAIEFERVIHNTKYERYSKKKTKIHARLPECMENEVNVGDYVQVGECRPLSKIIHFVYLNKVREADSK